ncbi:Transmembrane protein 50-like protein [Diplonema papillatum]|nr:Transmembrane protein 50-like protein [Diplonema papillatum]
MFEEDRKPDKRLLLAFASGVIFAAGWVLFVDGEVMSKRAGSESYTFKEWAPGLVATIAFVLMNCVTPIALSASNAFYDEKDTMMNKAWFFFSVLVMFTALTIAVVFMVTTYGSKSGSAQWPGTALLLQTVLVCIAAIVFFLSRGKKAEEF